MRRPTGTSTHPRALTKADSRASNPSPSAAAPPEPRLPLASESYATGVFPSKHHSFSRDSTARKPAISHISWPPDTHSLPLLQIVSRARHGTMRCELASIAKKSSAHASYNLLQNPAHTAAPLLATPPSGSHTEHSSSAQASRHLSDEASMFMWYSVARTASVCCAPQHVFRR
eukprot:CAMPEP_0170145500 /NCGR_PEP_ID=MMETSP0033_2-20121228/22121_1 /TAXON_ID=195969 /ORGANISM="Dolichomastix tenuilepis, Strain CCMP3274" /LENGTH=172 /DNA_ID=CAMNT_0010382093 /DNA_START=189 /DNA_END=707 /DNA_ORIENTATION=+